MALKLFISNRLESLADIFKEKIHQDPPSDIFASESVVIQTKGMELYLRKYLASGGGAAANIETPFLNRFLQNTMAVLLSKERFESFRKSSNAFSPQVLKWHIHQELFHHAIRYPQAAAFAEDPDLCHQLATQLAELFDRYIWYFPDMLNKWRNPEYPDDHWERTLYCALLQQLGPSPDCFVPEAGNAPPERTAKLPERISFFGIGTMPVLLFEFLKLCANFTEINLFCLNPSREYWTNARSSYQLRREAAEKNLPEPESQLDNPLLANLGQWGMDFFDSTVDLLTGDPGESSFTEPLDPEHPTLLTQLQQNILDSVNHNENTAVFSKDDHSVSVHSCHSKRREVEVLQDQLLLAVDELKIKPEDIIVMAPDINVYAPFLDAVFSNGPFRNVYSISDRSLSAVSSAAETLMRILDLSMQRCTVSELLTIIDTPVIRENFSFEDRDMEMLKQFIRNSAIGWGENGKMREQFSQINFDEFSWQEGLERLLLGYAAQENLEQLALPYAPAGNISGDTAELLGCFIHIVKKLFSWRERMQNRHSPEEWISLLEEIVSSLFDKSSSCASEIRQLRSGIYDWARCCRTAEFTLPIPLKTLKWELAGIVENKKDSGNFLKRGITCCSLIPMRSIPAKVIAVLGLVSNAFPGKDTRQALRAFPPRKGERSRIKEDRYLFLETLLSARQRLILLYPGQASDSKTSITPSAPLAELLNYLKNEFDFQETRQLRHSFDCAYFQNDGTTGYFSYSDHACEIARAAVKENQEPSEKTDQSPALQLLPDTTQLPEKKEYNLQDLAEILADPLQTFLQNSTGIRNIKADDFSAADKEPLTVKLTDPMLMDIFNGTALEELLQQQKHNRKLPPGTWGEHLLQNQYLELCKQLKQIDPDRQKQLLTSVESMIHITLPEGYVLFGDKIRQIPESGDQVFISSYFSAKSCIRFYLNSLCNVIQTGTSHLDWAFFQDHFRVYQTPEPDAARKKLLDLLAVAETARRQLIPLFPKAGVEFASSHKIEKSFTAFQEKDLVNQYYRMFFKKEDWTLMEEEFRRLVQLVYEPFF